MSRTLNRTVLGFHDEHEATIGRPPVARSARHLGRGRIRMEAGIARRPAVSARLRELVHLVLSGLRHCPDSNRHMQRHTTNYSTDYMSIC